MVHRSLRFKPLVLELAGALGNDRKVYESYNVPRSTFYEWKKRYQREGRSGLRRSKPVGRSWPNQLSPSTEEKILELRRSHQLGPQRIAWYLERYHGVKTSCSTVYRSLKRHGLSRLPTHARRRPLPTRRYAKRVPGHHIQVDVTFLSLKDESGRNIRRYQYTAIDDATRIRALRVYARHNQKNAIDFLDYVVEKFPFRIHTVRTDRGHEFQSQFHWHVEDRGMRHVYIKPRSPHLNGKVERSHRTDKEEFYQLLTYRGDVDLHQKLAEWERFYNLSRPHTALRGKTPYEALKILLA